MLVYGLKSIILSIQRDTSPISRLNVSREVEVDTEIVIQNENSQTNEFAMPLRV